MTLQLKVWNDWHSKWQKTKDRPHRDQHDATQSTAVSIFSSETAVLQKWQLKFRCIKIVYLSTKLPHQITAVNNSAVCKILLVSDLPWSDSAVKHQRETYLLHISAYCGLALGLCLSRKPGGLVNLPHAICHLRGSMLEGILRRRCAWPPVEFWGYQALWGNWAWLHIQLV